MLPALTQCVFPVTGSEADSALKSSGWIASAILAGVSWLIVSRANRIDHPRLNARGRSSLQDARSKT